MNVHEKQLKDGGTVLIVEDEIFVGLDIERALKDIGYAVCGIAADGQEALELAPEADFALIDINLREGRTGPIIAEALYRRFGIRSMFVTANPSQIGQPPLGALGYVCKPFDSQMLHAAMRWASGDGHSLPDNDAVVPLTRQSGG